MPEPTVPEAIAPARDHAPPQPIPPDPDLRPIDLAVPSHPDHLDDGAREHLARAGQEALDACLRRFAPEERAAFWRAICRCYNRPYNPADAALTTEAAIRPAEVVPIAVVPEAPDAYVPAPHVIEAVRPVREGASPDAASR